MRHRDNNFRDSLTQVTPIAEGGHCRIDLVLKLKGLMIMEIKGIVKIVRIL